jgi:hypothetical protein
VRATSLWSFVGSRLISACRRASSEVDLVLVAYEHGAFELTLFNRGILLIFYDDERIRRMHRALCVVHDAVERLGGTESG